MCNAAHNMFLVYRASLKGLLGNAKVLLSHSLHQAIVFTLAIFLGKVVYQSSGHPLLVIISYRNHASQWPIVKDNNILACMTIPVRGAPGATNVMLS
jgi:hypothetical protein